MSAIDAPLSWSEFHDAHQVGLARWTQVRIRNLKQTQGPRYQPPAVELWHHIMGAAGELAVARWLGIYWPGSNLDGWQNGAPDMGRRTEVKSLCSNPDGPLWVRRNPEHLFVLVDATQIPRLRIIGWLDGTDAPKAGTYVPADGYAHGAHKIEQAALFPPHLIDRSAV